MDLPDMCLMDCGWRSIAAGLLQKRSCQQMSAKGDRLGVRLGWTYQMSDLFDCGWRLAVADL